MISLMLSFAILSSSPAPVTPNVDAPGIDLPELVPVPVPAASPRAIEYYRSGLWVWAGVKAWRLFVPVVILFTGISRRIRDLAQQVGRSWSGTIAAYAVIYLLIMFTIDLPLDYYIGYVRPHAYDLSEQSVSRWFEQLLKTRAVMTVAAVTCLWLPYLLLARAAKRWWLYVAAMTFPISVFITLILPVWIDPLYNTFAPLKAKHLEARILELADRAGIEGGRVFEVDKSRDTKTVNAYVTGLFGTKRIVLWDTLLAQRTEKEVLAVMGHEMGHYVLNHVLLGVFLATCGAVGVLFMVDRLGRLVIGRFHVRFGFDRLSDVASVPLFIFLLSLLNLVGSPLHLAISRAMEHEADRFALEITRANHSAGSAFARIQRENLGNPRPGGLSVLFRSSHPPLGERIDFCNSYHPWTNGIPGRYERLFRDPR